MVNMVPKSPQVSRVKHPKIIVAIPCLNTENSIKDVVSKAKRYADQIVVIDDGSHDNTAELASAAEALVIKHRTNRGYGEAIKSCFDVAKANGHDILVILDGDGQHNPESIPQILEPLITGEADLVIGSRFLTSKCNIPTYRRFGIHIINILWNFGSKVKVSDTQSGFRAYSRKMFKTFLLSENGMSSSIETLEKARMAGVVINEVPISCTYVPSRINLKAMRHGFTVALSVIRIRLKNGLHSLIGDNNAGEKDLRDWD